MSSRSSPCTCNRLRRASRAMTQLYDGALAPTGLRVTQYALLRTLAGSGPRTISWLARALLLDRTALSRTLDPLVERGLVDVHAGSDARTREVALTPAGRRLLDDAEPHWLAAQGSVARRLGRDRLDELYALLADVEAMHPTEGARTGGPS